MLLTHLLKRCCNVSLHQPVLDSKEQVATFYLWNLSGQLVGYQQYRPTAPKHHTEPKLAIPATLGVLSSTCTKLSRDNLFLQGCEIDTRCQPLRPARHPAKEKAMTKNTTVTLDEAVANSAALAEQWASSCRK